MTDISQSPASGAEPMRTTTSLLTESDRTRRRNAAEKRFRIYGMIAIAIALSILAIMLFTIIRDGSSAFVQAKLTFPVTIDESVVDKTGNRDPAEMARVTTIGYGRVLATSLVEYMDERKHRGRRHLRQGDRRHDLQGRSRAPAEHGSRGPPRWSVRPSPSRPSRPVASTAT